MLDPDLLKILRCPETHQNLSVGGESIVQQLNQEIQAGRLRNRAGSVIEEPLDGCLVRSDGQYAYPIRQRIPVLLTEEAIPLASVASAG